MVCSTRGKGFQREKVCTGMMEKARAIVRHPVEKATSKPDATTRRCMSRVAAPSHSPNITGGDSTHHPSQNGVLRYAQSQWPLQEPNLEVPSITLGMAF